MEIASPRLIARLIVEELMVENQETLERVKSQIDDNMAEHNPPDFNGIEKSETLIKTEKGRGNLEDNEALQLVQYLKNKQPQQATDDTTSTEPEEENTSDQEEGDKEETPLPSTTVLKPALEKLARFLLRTAVLAESLERFFVSLRPKEPKKLSSSFKENFSKEETDILKKYFKTKDNTIKFINQYFGNNPEKETILSNLEKIYSGEELPPAGEDKPDEKPDEPSKEPYEIEKKIKDDFIDAADQFRNEFYNQRYRKNQAIILKNLIDAISKITDDGNFEMAYGDVKDEEKTDQQPLQEADENVEANEKQVQQLKMDFRSLLSDINKTTKSLKAFEEVASKGSVLTDAYKKNFMELLASLQKTLFLVVRDMLNIIKKPETVQEAKEESEKMKTFRAVKKAYSNAVKGVIAVRELLDGQTTEEKPENVIGDTYQAVVNLSQYFPSINPFNKGAKTKQDYENYLDSFKAAVKSVKSSLGNVLNFVKQGETGEATINSTIRELKSFSAKIAAIFGVESQFKDKVVEPNTPAAEDTEPQDQPPRVEVYFEEDGLDIIENDTERQKAIAEKIQELNLGDENQAQALQKLINLMIVHMKEKEALQEQENEPFESDLVDNAFKVAYQQLSGEEKESIKEIIKKDDLGISGLQKIASSIIAAVMIEGAVQQIKADKPDLEDVEIVDYAAEALKNYTVVPIANFISTYNAEDIKPTLDIPEFEQVLDKIQQGSPTSQPTEPDAQPVQDTAAPSDDTVDTPTSDDEEGEPQADTTEPSGDTGDAPTPDAEEGEPQPAEKDKMTQEQFDKQLNTENKNFSNKDLTAAKDMKKIDGLFDYNFENSNLEGVNLTNSSFQRTNFKGANLKGAKLQGFGGKYTNQPAKKDNPNDFTNANLSGADLRLSRFVEGIFKNADLPNAKLSNAKFIECNFQSADLSGAKLHGADVSTSTFNGTNLQGLEYNKRTKWPADLTEEELNKRGAKNVEKAKKKQPKTEPTPEEQDLIPLRFTGWQERANQIDTEINKMFEEAGKSGSLVEAAKKVVRKFMQEIDPKKLKESIEDEIDEPYREAFKKAVREVQGSGTLLRMLDMDGNEQLKKKFARFLKQLILGVDKKKGGSSKQSQKAPESQPQQGEQPSQAKEEDAKTKKYKEEFKALNTIPGKFARKVIKYAEDVEKYMTTSLEKDTVKLAKQLDFSKIDNIPKEDIEKAVTNGDITAGQSGQIASLINRASRLQSVMALVGKITLAGKAEQKQLMSQLKSLEKDLYGTFNNWLKSKNIKPIQKIDVLETSATASGLTAADAVTLSNELYNKYEAKVAYIDSVALFAKDGKEITAQEGKTKIFSTQRVGSGTAGKNFYGQKK